jgi:hypothetical protein
LSKEKVLFTRIGDEAVFDSIPLVDVKSVQPINEPPQSEAATSSTTSNPKAKDTDFRKTGDQHNRQN